MARELTAIAPSQHALSRRARRLCLAAVVASVVSLGTGAFAASTALAFNCGSNGSNQQWDAYNTSYGHFMHAWLGQCTYTNKDFVTVYAGQDSRYSWGGSYYNDSSMHVDLDVGNCYGGTLWNQGITYYNSAYQQLVDTGQTSSTGCVDFGASGDQTVTGEFEWSWNL